MNDKISLNKKEMLNLLFLAYESGCHGYLDLKNMSCEKILDDFIENNIKKDASSTNLEQDSIFFPSTETSIAANWIEIFLQIG